MRKAFLMCRPTLRYETLLHLFWVGRAALPCSMDLCALVFLLLQLFAGRPALAEREGESRH